MIKGIFYMFQPVAFFFFDDRNDIEPHLNFQVVGYNVGIGCQGEPPDLPGSYGLFGIEDEVAASALYLNDAEGISFQGNEVYFCLSVSVIPLQQGIAVFH